MFCSLWQEKKEEKHFGNNFSQLMSLIRIKGLTEDESEHLKPEVSLKHPNGAFTFTATTSIRNLYSIWTQGSSIYGVYGQAIELKHINHL